MTNQTKKSAKKAAPRQTTLTQLRRQVIGLIEEQERLTKQIRDMLGIGSEGVGIASVGADSKININRNPAMSSYIDKGGHMAALHSSIRDMYKQLGVSFIEGVYFMGDLEKARLTEEHKKLLLVINSQAAEISRKLGIPLPQIKGNIKLTNPIVGEIHIYREDLSGELHLIKSIRTTNLQAHLFDDLNS